MPQDFMFIGDHTKTHVNQPLEDRFAQEGILEEDMAGRIELLAQWLSIKQIKIAEVGLSANIPADRINKDTLQHLPYQTLHSVYCDLYSKYVARQQDSESP